MGKIQSKQGYATLGIGRHRGEPEGEHFIVNTNPSSEDEFSVSIPNLNQVAELNKHPLQVVLPPETNEDGFFKREDDARSEKDDSLLINIQEVNDSILNCARGSGDNKNELNESDSAELNVTLYQPDGKLTHNDIGRLVKRIFSTVGDKMSEGNNTLNIKLTVSPTKDDSQLQQDSKCDIQTNEKPKELPRTSSPLVKKSSSRKNHHSNERLHFADHHDDQLSQSLNSSPAFVLKHYPITDKNLNRSVSTCSPRLRRRKHLESKFQEQQLRDVIQESMQKNNLGKPMDRRPQFADNCARSCSMKYKNRDNIAECEARRDHYRDLAGVEHCSKLCDHKQTYADCHQHLRRSHSHNEYDAQFQYKKLQNSSSKYHFLNYGLLHGPVDDNRNLESPYSCNHHCQDNLLWTNTPKSSNKTGHKCHIEQHHHNSDTPRQYKRQPAKVSFEEEIRSTEADHHRHHHRSSSSKRRSSRHYVHEHHHHHYHHCCN